MRVILTFLAIAAVIGAATYALPAHCDSCMTSGMTCYADMACGSANCRCIRIHGMGNPGVCG